MQGKWIWIDDKSTENTYGEFITRISYAGGEAFLELSADTEYAIFLNGEFVNAGQYADFPWYKIRDRHDISAHLRMGENELKIVVWYMGDNNFIHYIHRPALRFDVLVDGKIVACSSQDTACRLYPVLVSGEVKKINRQSGYSFVWRLGAEEAYHKATVLTDMPRQTFLRPIENLQLLPKKAAKPLEKAYDLGEETVGYPYVVLRAAKGARVFVSFGEWLDENGELLRYRNDGAYDFSFEIVGNGEKTTVFNPLRKLGCRYLAVEGDCEIFEIGLLPVRYPFERKKKAFDCSTRERIYGTAVKTLELNAFDHYYDCPWREQAFWVLDSWLQMRYGYFAFEGTAYQRAALRLIGEERHPDGLISMVVPSSSMEVIPSFSLAYVWSLAEYTQYSDDISLAQEYFEKAVALVRLYTDRAENGLIPCFENRWNFYEWNERLAGDSGKRFDAVLSLMTVFSLQKLGHLCERLGKSEESVYCKNAERALKEAIFAAFYDEEDGLFKTFEDEKAYSELVNALAVLCYVVEGEKAVRICEKLVLGQGLIKATLSMTAFKYDALLKTDREKYGAYVLQDIDESFSYMLSQGATSFWETLKGAADFNGAGSLCHGWSTLPVYYYSLLGVAKE